MFNRVRSTSRFALVASAGLALAALGGCNGAAGPSPSPSAPSLDACLVGTWTTIAQNENSPANDEDITYKGGAGEIFTIDPSGTLTIDTHAAEPVDFESGGETFTATVSGTGHGTLTTGVTGTRKVLYFTPDAADTRKTLSKDSTGAELGPARADTPFSAVYTCAPGRFTFYKSAVNYMIDGPIVELKSGSAPAPSTASPSPS